jgi:hypothetical protein
MANEDIVWRILGKFGGRKLSRRLEILAGKMSDVFLHVCQPRRRCVPVSLRLRLTCLRHFEILIPCLCRKYLTSFLSNATLFTIYRLAVSI